MFGEEFLVLDDQLLELVDLVAFETSVRGHDTILPRLRMNVRGYSTRVRRCRRRLIRMIGDEDELWKAARQGAGSTAGDPKNEDRERCAPF